MTFASCAESSVDPQRSETTYERKIDLEFEGKITDGRGDGLSALVRIQERLHCEMGNIVLSPDSTRTNAEGFYELDYFSTVWGAGCFVFRVSSENPTPRHDSVVIHFDDLEEHGDPYGTGLIRVDLTFDSTDLYPRTDPLNAAMSGPWEGPPNTWCTWHAEATGGDPPYSYEWSGLLSGTGSTVDGYIGSSSAQLYLDVVDSAGDTASTQTWIRVDEEAQPCHGGG